MQFDFGFAPRPKLSLAEVEAVIKKNRILTPCPSRQTLTEYCEEGVFEAIQIRAGGMWYVFEDSFRAWIKSLDAPTIERRESSRLENRQQPALLQINLAV